MQLCLLFASSQLKKFKKLTFLSQINKNKNECHQNLEIVVSNLAHGFFFAKYQHVEPTEGN